MTMGISRKKVTKTTRKVMMMNGTRKLHSVSQFSLSAPGNKRMYDSRIEN